MKIEMVDFSLYGEVHTYPWLDGGLPKLTNLYLYNMEHMAL
jgi:hypothetical protein